MNLTSRFARAVIDVKKMGDLPVSRDLTFL